MILIYLSWIWSIMLDFLILIAIKFFGIWPNTALKWILARIFMGKWEKSHPGCWDNARMNTASWIENSRYRHKTRNLRRTAVKIRKFIPNVDLYTFSFIHFLSFSQLPLDFSSFHSRSTLRRSWIFTIHRPNKSYIWRNKIYVDSYSEREMKK